MNTIKVAFQYFWGDFDLSDNVFTWLLSHKYNVVIDQQNPDVVISCGGERRYSNCTYIYYSAEPYYPTDENEIRRIMDYCMTGYHLNRDFYLRFPLYLYYIYEYQKRNYAGFDIFNKHRNVDISTKSGFCVFIARGFSGYRAKFVDRLIREYKRVDVSFGPYKNISVPGEPGTINGSISKINFIKKYKFVMAFENCSVSGGFNGYTTEKLIEPMIAGSLPIYWGNNRISEDFNSNTFLNLHDFNSEDEFFRKIVEVDRNDDLYRSYFSEKLKNDSNNLLDTNVLPEHFFNIIKI